MSLGFRVGGRGDSGDGYGAALASRLNELVAALVALLRTVSRLIKFVRM